MHELHVQQLYNDFLGSSASKDALLFTAGRLLLPRGFLVLSRYGAGQQGT
jgi:hypothetical protein